MGSDVKALAARLRQCEQFFASDYGYPQAATCREAAEALEKAEKVIGPFADAAVDPELNYSDEDQISNAMPCGWITHGDLRAAADWKQQYGSKDNG